MPIETGAGFLDIERVGFTYPGWPPIVRGIDWHLPRGEIHGLVGRSGCGKTTLLKLAAGLLRPQAGQVRLRGRVLRSPGPDMGFGFQSPTLLDWLRVIDNVLLPVSLHRRPGPSDVDEAHRLLALLGLADRALHYPRQLSGGQQSRVALARALVLRPALLLLDEPFAALDAITRGELQDDLLELCRVQRTSVLFVTHDIAEAVYLCDRVAVMHEGRIVQDVRVGLARPRSAAMRYGADFNRHCAQVRSAMDEAVA